MDAAISALRLIEKCVDEAPEISRDLHKLGALSKVLSYVNDTNPDLSDIALRILSFSLPNNLALQREAWSQGCMDILLQEGLALSSTRLGAISGLLRHAPEIERDFLAKGGYVLLSKALTASDDKVMWCRRTVCLCAFPKAQVQLKAANLLRHLAIEGVLDAACAIKAGVGSGLVALLKHPDLDTSGIQMGEVCAEAAVALLKAIRFQLSKATDDEGNNELDKIIEALKLRIQRLQEQHPQERAEEIHKCKEALQIALGVPRKSK